MSQRRHAPHRSASLRSVLLMLIGCLAIGSAVLCAKPPQIQNEPNALDYKAQRQYVKFNEDIQKLVVKAQKFAQSRKFDKAIHAQYEAVMKSLMAYDEAKPVHLDLLRTLAVYNDSAGRTDEALALYQTIYDRATQAMPEFDRYRLDRLYELALVRYNHGQDSMAIELIESILPRTVVERPRDSQLYANACKLYADWRMAHAATQRDSIYANLFQAFADATQYRVDHPDINEHELHNRAVDTFQESASLYNFGNRDEAVDSMISAIRLWYTFLGPFDQSVSNAKKALGFYANKRKDMKTAITCYHEALFIDEYIGLADEFDYSKTMADLSKLYYFSRDPQGTTSASTDAYNSYRDLICKNFASLSGQERAEFWDMCHSYFEKTLPSFAIHIPSLTATCYNAVLLSKGLLLNADTELRQLILNSADPALISKFNTVRNLRRNIEDQLYLPEARRDQSLIEMSRNTARALEKEIVETCDRDGQFTGRLSTRWQDVAAKLGPDEVAIEFQYIPFGGWDTHGYAALVLKAGMDAPKQQYLCMDDDIKRIRPADYYTTNALSELIWGPLRQFTDGCKKIYFAPAGMIYNVAIESLPSPSGSGYVADHTDIYRLSSTRELVKASSRVPFNTAAVYGGLFYSPQQEQLFNAPEELRDSLEMTFSIDGMSYLPASRIEADTVSHRLKDDPDRRVYFYTGMLGSESSFKNLSGKGVNLIHVATHGHYYDPEEAKFHRDLRFINAAMSQQSKDAISTEDRMLSRSGLYFAGANTYSRNALNPGILDDGILTAKEISELDFRGLDLVVLSACETGLGDVTGDGVYGLQRGFKKAGANSLLMSLWKIDDEATSILMNSFYRHLCSGMGKYASLKAAQTELRNFTTTDGYRPYASPSFWGAFVILDALN